MIFYVLFLQASQPSTNFNISELVYKVAICFISVQYDFNAKIKHWHANKDVNNKLTLLRQVWSAIIYFPQVSQGC